MPGMLVARPSSTAIKPRGSVATPARAAEVVGVRAAPDGEEHVRGDDLRLSRRAIDEDGRSLRVPAEPDALGSGAHRDALLDENGPDGLRNPLVLAGDQARPLLDDRDLGPEAPMHLRELEPDVAAADDDEMLGHPVEPQDRAVGQV